MLHLPREAAKRHANAQRVGVEGVALLDALEDDQTPAGLRPRPLIDALRRPWLRHDERRDGGTAAALIRFKAHRERPQATEVRPCQGQAQPILSGQTHAGC